MKQKYHKYFVVLLSVVIFILPTKYVQAQNHPLSIDEAIIKWQNILVNSTTQRNVGADPIIPVLWKPLFIPANTSVLDIAIDPTNSAKIFLGTDNASMPVIYSNDFGRTWITQTLGLPDAGSTILDVDPISPNYVYVGFRVSEGVYRSDNGGQTWEAKNNGIISIDGDISALIVHPITPTLIMAGTASGIPYIYRSENRGESWSAIPLTGPNNRTVTQIVVDPHTPSKIYTVVQGEGIFISTDGGKTWDNSGIQGSSIAVDPMDPDKLYRIQCELYESGNGGVDWNLVPTPDPCYETLLTDPFVGNLLYLSSQFRQVTRSADGGKTWILLDETLDGNPAPISSSAFAIDPANTNRLFVFGDALIRSDLYVSFYLNAFYLPILIR